MSDERAQALETRPTNRRLFFRRVAALGGGAVIGGGAVLALSRAGSDEGEPRPAQRAAGEKGTGYRLTDHIATYYDKARL